MCDNSHFFEYSGLCQRKNAALHALIKELDFPLFLFLQEQLPDQFVFHPLYVAYFSHTTKNSIGVAVLIRRIQHLTVMENHYSPDHRALVVRIPYESVSARLPPTPLAPLTPV